MSEAAAELNTARFPLSRPLAVIIVLFLMAISPVYQALEARRALEAGSGAVDPVTEKIERLKGMLSGVAPGAQVGYITDFEENGDLKWRNFYMARYAALPVVLRRFEPTFPLVLVDMRSQEGIGGFCATWGYKVIKEGPAGVALVEKAR